MIGAAWLIAPDRAPAQLCGGGGFSSGCSGGPSQQPTLAKTLSYNANPFNDDFQNCKSIDLANTGSAGFNWYLRNATAANPTFGITQANTISCAASKGLTISQFSNTGSGEFSLLSAYWVSGTTINGNTFAGGTGIDFYIQWSVTPTNVATGCAFWPVFWPNGTTVLTETSTYSFIEADVSEKFCGSSNLSTNDGNVHQWDTTLCAPGNDCTAATNYPAADSNTHSYEMAWVPAASNGGTGEFLFAYDGQQQSGMTVTYTSAGGSSPATTPTNPAGVFYNTLDTTGQTWVLLLNAGSSQSITVRRISVWKK